MQTMTVPDLHSGFMMMGYDGSNRWQTAVECVLARRVPGQAEEQYAYLSHECRAERVCDDPFGHPGEYEYVGISTWAGNYAMRSGPALAGVRSAPRPGDDVKDFSYEQIAGKTAVFCDRNEAQRLSFEQVKHLLQTDFEDGYRKLYVAVSFRQGANEYTLYAPARYINFPHPTETDRSYLQPISGYVLYEKDERFFTAYVVAYIEEGQTRGLQFKVRDTVSYGDVSTHEFCRTERIDDDRMTCEFFAY